MKCDFQAPNLRTTQFSTRARHAAKIGALLLATLSLDASALINVNVHADFPASGFTEGAVFSTVGPQSFDVAFQVDETAAVRYSAGYAVVPGSFALAHDVYAVGYDAIVGATSFQFGTQTFSGMSLHNLSFALLQDSTLFAPMFLSNLTPGAATTIEVALAPGIVHLGSYGFGPFVPNTPRLVSLTNEASVFDGRNVALGQVQVSISAVPEPDAAWMMALGLLPLWLLQKGRRG